MASTGSVSGSTPIVSIVNQKSEAAKAKLLRQLDVVERASERGVNAAAAVLEPGTGLQLDVSV